MSTLDPLIDVAGLTKTYAGRTVVTGVTFTVNPGDLVGLVGANGGGKTTTLRLLAGLLRPDAGHGRVLGEDVDEPRSRRRGRIGYMGQRLCLYPDLSVAENLRFRARVFGLPRPARSVAETLARYGLAAVADQRFGTLSGGWARRVQFAACTLHAPPLLLLDEPTAGLDVRSRHDMWTWLAAQAAAGCGVVVSTHDLAEAQRCPVILYYRDGLIQGPTTPGALIARAGATTLEAAVLALATAATI